MSAYNLETVRAVGWGITHEADALRMYQIELGGAVIETGTD